MGVRGHCAPYIRGYSGWRIFSGSSPSFYSTFTVIWILGRNELEGGKAQTVPCTSSVVRLKVIQRIVVANAFNPCCCRYFKALINLALVALRICFYFSRHMFHPHRCPQRVGVMSLEVTGEKLISGGDDSMIRIWNTNNWTCEQILRAHQVYFIYWIAQCRIIQYWVNRGACLSTLPFTTSSALFMITEH